jgi:hypothetical protein
MTLVVTTTSLTYAALLFSINTPVSASSVRPLRLRARPPVLVVESAKQIADQPLTWCLERKELELYPNNDVY